jgi:hypothetical protein
MVAGAIVLMVLGKKILNMLVDSVPVKFLQINAL